MKIKSKIIVIICVVIGLLLLAVGIVCFVQRDNISALLDSRKYTKEELALRLDENKKELQVLLKGYLPPYLRDLTAEEEMQLLNGEITLEEAKKAMGLKREQEIASSNGRDEEKNQTSAEAQIITTYTSQLYSIKAQYISLLGGVASNAAGEFAGLAEKNATTKAEILSKYYGQASALEGACDGKVASVLNKMESELSAIGADTSIVSKMQSQYEAEKASKKAYYLSQI